LRLSNPLDYLKKLSNSGDFHIYTTPEVLAEFKDFESKHLLEAFMEKISVIPASRKYMDRVLSQAKKVGGKELLSKTDLSVLALGLQLMDRGEGDDVVIISEDFDIQNLAVLMGMKYASIRKRNITKVLTVYKKCTACGAVYDESLSECPNCGFNGYRLVYKRIKTF